MKKLVTTLLLMAYGLASSGMVVTLHFCCGKLDGISLEGKAPNNCSHDPEKRMPGCCDDAQVAFSLPDEYGSAHASGVPAVAFEALAAQWPGASLPPVPVAVSTPSPAFAADDGPPGSPPLFLLFCVFRR